MGVQEIFAKEHRSVRVLKIVKGVFMVVLHIARVDENRASGVSVVVPQHIRAQSAFATVAFLNLADHCPEGVDNFFTYQKPFLLDELTPPFNKPDIVIFHEVYRPSFIAISRILRREGIPYIVVPHGSLTQEAQSMKWIKKKVANFLVFNRFVNCAAAVQCLSEKEMNTSNVKAAKFIGTNGCCVPEQQKLGFGEGKIRFSYVGRLDAFHKGLDLMLDAFKMLVSTPYAKKCELNIYGPDYQGRYARLEGMIAERGLGEFVTLHPAVFGKEKESVLLGTDVFVQTSRFEGMPMGILEALAYGLPCLITKGTTLGDSVEKYDAGWVAETNVQSVFECLVRAIEGKENFWGKSLGALALINENFVWDKIADNAVKAYQKFSGTGEE